MTVFALYNGYLGLSRKSAWHSGICVYYLLLIERSDNVINMCELKFTSEDFSVDKGYYRVLLSRPERIREIVSPKVSIQSTLITT